MSYILRSRLTSYKPPRPTPPFPPAPTSSNELFAQEPPCRVRAITQYAIRPQPEVLLMGKIVHSNQLFTREPPSHNKVPKLSLRTPSTAYTQTRTKNKMKIFVTLRVLHAFVVNSPRDLLARKLLAPWPHYELRMDLQPKTIHRSSFIVHQSLTLYGRLRICPG